MISSEAEGQEERHTAAALLLVRPWTVLHIEVSGLSVQVSGSGPEAEHQA
ncbi:MAG: hypothetical protein HN742_23375 [Lentisphaerae bacterium]|jgi:hypothetical protein|nr:hypothetical protein [Lentisphaerota bacterium]MBT4820101.1 hypothetical protein [Lentisphaerota bacterium]MBT5605169.1 hypothetical protein [Lentisphaerota bacterium]MBT7054379.1 hypothetical protein [Lentisphaerota bacterium]MBT7844837.1 hypothetical protein [Lentisphaerota bacterium]